MVSTPGYELLPTDDSPSNNNQPDSDEESDSEPSSVTMSTVSSTPTPPPHDPRFDQPTPSPYKRAALLIFLAFLFWLAFSLRKASWVSGDKPKVVHASRYSKEFKFRPAASPIVTERLKDGRMRVRGAQPALISTPAPSKPPADKKRKRSKRGKRQSKPKKAKRV